MYFIRRATFANAILVICIFCTCENDLGCHAGSLVKSVYPLITCLGLYAFQLFIHASMPHTPFVNLPFVVGCYSQGPALTNPVQFSPRKCVVRAVSRSRRLCSVSVCYLLGRPRQMRCAAIPFRVIM